MKTLTTSMINDYAEKAESEIAIGNHKMMAEHLKASSQYHQEAARLYAAGDFEKAKLNALVAKGYQCLACQVQRESEKKILSDN